MAVLLLFGGQVTPVSGRPTPGDQDTRLVPGFGPTSLHSSGRLDAFYGDSGFSGSLLVERPAWSRFPLRPVVRLSYIPLPFDEAGFHDHEGVSPSVPVDGNSAKLVISSVGVMGYPLAGFPVRPHFGVKIATGTLKEKYRYSNLEPGPVFPSGTLISRNKTVSLWGAGISAGASLALSRTVQPYFDVEYLWLGGGEDPLRLVPVWVGLALVIDQRD